MLSSTTMSRSAGDFATAGDASSRTVRAARDALEGRRKGVAAALPFVGPA